MQIPCVYVPGPAPAVSVANIKYFNLTFQNIKKNVKQYCQLLVQKWLRKFQMESGKAYAVVC